MFRPSRILPRAALLVALFAMAAPLLAQERRSDTLFTVEKYLDFEQVADPQISPDGSQIIYTRRSQQARRSVRRRAVDHERRRQRRIASSTKGGGARWSPDGTRIAYLADGEPRGHADLRPMDGRRGRDVADHARRRRPRGHPVVAGRQVDRLQHARADGADVAHRHAGGAAGREVDAGARSTRTSLHYRQDRAASRSPAIVHLFVVSADGGTPRADHHGEWNVGARFDGQAGAVGWDWMPDGKTIVVDGDRRSRRPTSKYRNSSISLDRRRDRREAAAHVARRRVERSGRVAGRAQDRVQRIPAA